MAHKEKDLENLRLPTRKPSWTDTRCICLEETVQTNAALIPAQEVTTTHNPGYISSIISTHLIRSFWRQNIYASSRCWPFVCFYSGLYLTYDLSLWRSIGFNYSFQLGSCIAWSTRFGHDNLPYPVLSVVLLYVLCHLYPRNITHIHTNTETQISATHTKFIYSSSI